MRYFANASSPTVREAMHAGVIDQIVTPAERRAPIGVPWIADNSVFGGKYPGNRAYVSWLASQPHGRHCVFAVAPDVVGDHEATLHRSLPMLATLRAVAGRVAFVAQNGATPSWVPWPDFDALFIGGTTEWKLGADARHLAAAARRQGKWVHMGRVNSGKRFRYAESIGCNSVDGTFLAFGPDKNLSRLRRWL